MVHSIFLALWFFVPAGFANAAPVFAAAIPWLRRFTVPLDCGKSYKGVRIFGANKTWRGLIAGILFAALGLALQRYAYIHTDWAKTLSAPINYQTIPLILLSILFAVGALGGDAIESFFKRRQGVAPGHSWFPLDQIDYVIGAILATLPIVRLTPVQYAAALLLGVVLHVFFTYIGYLIKLRDRPI